jgi:hypothetical protein
VGRRHGKGVKERLSTKAYEYLGTYGPLRSRTDTEAILTGGSRRGGGKDVSELREVFQNLLEEFEIR